MTAEEIAAEVAEFAPEPSVFRAIVNGQILGEYDTAEEMVEAMRANGAPIDHVFVDVT